MDRDHEQPREMRPEHHLAFVTMVEGNHNLRFVLPSRGRTRLTRFKRAAGVPSRYSKYRWFVPERGDCKVTAHVQTFARAARMRRTAFASVIDGAVRAPAQLTMTGQRHAWRERCTDSTNHRHAARQSFPAAAQ